MARVPIGDIVRMPLPTRNDPDWDPFAPAPGNVPNGPSIPKPRGPLLPSLPIDLASNFVTGYTSGNAVPGYIGSDAPQFDREVTDGPYFVGTQPQLPMRPLINPWTRTPILHDKQLPGTLKRESPLRQQKYFPNAWDGCMMREAELWHYVAQHGGLKTCCRIPELGAPIWSQPPWQVKPSNAVDLEKMFSVATALVPFTGTDTIIGQFRVPIGFDGAISRFVCQFTGNGFDDFSGNIVWRLKVGQRFAKDLGNVTVTFGSFQTAFAVPGREHCRLVSGQTVTVFVSIPAGSPVNGGRITAGVFGWVYPHR